MYYLCVCVYNLSCRRSVLNNYNDTWVKNYMDKFDVMMESFHSAQITDLVGVCVCVCVYICVCVCVCIIQLAEY